MATGPLALSWGSCRLQSQDGDTGGPSGSAAPHSPVRDSSQGGSQGLRAPGTTAPGLLPPTEPVHSPATQPSFPSVVCRASSLPSGSSQPGLPPVPVPTSTTHPGLRHLSTSCLHLRNPVRFHLLHMTSPMAQNVLSCLSLLQPTGPHAVRLMLSNVTESQT